jgi:PTH1 family peptidyl-tRNA hydrolase
MLLVVGLGNPGKKYLKNRHNVGHLFVDRLSGEKSSSRAPALKIFKTSVFMNDSGGEVKDLVKKYQISPSQLVVAHDDMDLPLGEVRLQFGRGSAGHKGVESVVSSLGTQDFWRLRFGLGRPPDKVRGESYVIADFTKKEDVSLERSFAKALDLIKEHLS